MVKYLPVLCIGGTINHQPIQASIVTKSSVKMVLQHSEIVSAKYSMADVLHPERFKFLVRFKCYQIKDMVFIGVEERDS